MDQQGFQLRLQILSEIRFFIFLFVTLQQSKINNNPFHIDIMRCCVENTFMSFRIKLKENEMWRKFSSGKTFQPDVPAEDNV